jgi:hypothetical protein
MAQDPTAIFNKKAMPRISGAAYNYIRKYNDITWNVIAHYENRMTNGIGHRRRNVDIVQAHLVRKLFNIIVEKWGDDRMFWDALQEWNDAQTPPETKGKKK